MVHHVVCQQPTRDALIFHARTLGRPDPMLGAVEGWEPVLNGRGQSKWVYEPCDVHRNHGKVLTRCVVGQA